MSETDRVDGGQRQRADLAAMAAAIERLSAGLALAEEPGGFAAALEEAAAARPVRAERTP